MVKINLWRLEYSLCYNDYIICSTMKHDEKLLYFTTFEYV